MRNRDVPYCALCGGPLTPRGPLMGYRITTQRLVMNTQNARNFAGLSTMFGGPAGLALADVMATGDVVDEPKELRDEVVICETCSDETIGVLLERVNERRERTEEDAEVVD